MLPRSGAGQCEGPEGPIQELGLYPKRSGVGSQLERLVVGSGFCMKNGWAYSNTSPPVVRAAHSQPPGGNIPMSVDE